MSDNNQEKKEVTITKETIDGLMEYTMSLSVFSQEDLKNSCQRNVKGSSL